MIGRICLLAALCGIAATTAGAAAPLARNGLIAFASDRAENHGTAEVYLVRANGGTRMNISRGTTAFLDENPHPTWSPDGRRLAFAGAGGLRLANTDGSGRELLREGFYGETPTWSPDGRYIAVSAEGIWLISPSTRATRRLTRGESDSEALWSPNGKWLAFTRESGQFLIRPDGSGLRRLARDLTCSSWSPSGRHLACWRGNYSLTIIDVRSRKRRSFKVGSHPRDIEWSPTGRWIAVATRLGISLVSPDGSQRRTITNLRLSEPELTWSPSGTQIAFVARYYGSVYTASVNSPRLRRVVRNRCRELMRTPVWSPDGRHIAFSSLVYDNDPEIFTIRENGSGAKQLTRNCSRHDGGPKWSPDGVRLAFASAGDIYTMDPDGSGKRRLTRSHIDSAPSWSPDRAAIVFERYFPRRNDGELFTMRANGQGIRQLTRSAGWSADPAWSPRGDRIAFVRGISGQRLQIYVMNADGSGVVRLTDVAHSRGAEAPAWSPDGSQIAFVREYDIWKMNADGTEAVPVTSFRDGYTAADHPAWSPDGTKIVFSRDIDYDRSSRWALFVVGSAGGTPLMLPYAYQDNVEPDWQPVPQG